VGLHDRVRRSVPGNLARDARWWDRGLRDEPGGAAAPPSGASCGTSSPTARSPATPPTASARRGPTTASPTAPSSSRRCAALTPPAYAALWRFLLSLDLVRTMRAPTASPDDPLRHLLAEPRALRSQPYDALWVRLVDVGRALAARRYPAVNLVLEVRDRSLPVERRPLVLVGHPAGAFCAQTDADPDLVLTSRRWRGLPRWGLAGDAAGGRPGSPRSARRGSPRRDGVRWPVTPGARRVTKDP
jgi:hypothetical protein